MDRPLLNRTQALVLGFFVLALLSVVVIRVVQPGVYDRALGLPSGQHWVRNLFLPALASFILLLAVGVFRRWRWMFWLVMVAFLAGVLRVPVAWLELTGVLATELPAWYVVYQGLLGVLQFGIGLVMVAGYRRSGVWGDARGEPGSR